MYLHKFGPFIIFTDLSEKSRISAGFGYIFGRFNLSLASTMPVC